MTTLTPPALADITAHVERARQRAALGACPDHGGKSAIHCSPCAADRATGAAEDRDDWAKTRAMHECDRLFPRRFRDAMPAHPDILGWVATLADDPAAARSLLLYGRCGSGKTHQAYGALRSAIHARPDLAWAHATFPDFTAALRPRVGVDSEEELERFRSADLLLLDDLGTAKHSEWVEEITYRMINGRYADMRPTIFTTNLTMPELAGAVGDRVSGRLAETCVRVLLDGEDLRRPADRS